MSILPLYSWQNTAADFLERALADQFFALDASDTGTGKTFTALEVLRRMRTPGLVICPKAAMSVWRNWAATQEVDLLDVVNYEKLRPGRTQWMGRGRRKADVYWRLPPGTPVIFDEAHRCGGRDTYSAYMMAACKIYRIRVLAISATIADSPLRMRAIGFLSNMHRWRDFDNFLITNGCFRNFWKQWEFDKNPDVMHAMHHVLFPKFGTRVRIAELGDRFPENMVTAESYTVEEPIRNALDELYDTASKELTINMASSHMGLWREAEGLKVPLLAELVRDAVDEGRSAAVFVNFRDTVTALSELLATEFCPGFFHGGMNQAHRDAAIARFQANQTRVLICTIATGGASVSLHDLTGEYPRISFISPGYNSTDLKQALGRIHRAGAKSKAVQRIVFVAGTPEEDACAAVRTKLANLDRLNDGDLAAGLGWQVLPKQPPTEQI